MNAEHFRVLLIEDDHRDADLLNVALRRAGGQFEVDRSARMSDALKQLEKSDFDLILLDVGLPDCDRRMAVTTIRKVAPNLPIVVLTGLDSDAAAINALDEGAQDYLIKDRVTPDVLERAIRYAMVRQQNADMRMLLDQIRQREHALEVKNRRLAQLCKTAQEFVDNVSHEFRTPLTVVKEYVELLSEGLVGPVNTEQIRMLKVVEDRADDLNTMVDDMLDGSRIEAGMMSICRKQCRLAEIVDHIWPNLARKAEVKGVNLEIALDDDLPEVYCDAEKVGRVIVNLTVNAIKFSGQPGLVRLWAKQDAPLREIVVGVTDNGPGIDHQSLDIIFQRFKQLDSNPRGTSKGFGLGLSIAKELVDLNFGRMDVESQLGQGSTFSFTVPLAQPVEVMRRYLKRKRNARDGLGIVSLVMVHIDKSLDVNLANDVDAFLNYFLRPTDLMLRSDTHRWLLALASATEDLHGIFDRLTEARNEANRNRPFGPLPVIATATVGTWRAADHTDEILARTEETFEPPELAHSAPVRCEDH